MSEMGHSRPGPPSGRSGHVRNAPLATVGPKRAACRDVPGADILVVVTALRSECGEERLRLTNLGKLRRRRKAFERGRKYRVGIGGTAG
jgi:hypothetical protein